MTSLVDLHCHLDLYPDFEKLVLECEAEKIYTLAVTTTPQAWPKNFALTKDKKYVRAGLGLHPQLVAQRFSELSLWDEYFSECRFIGEIGLDAGSAYYSSFSKQITVFEHIIKKCADHGGKILTVHSVKSAAQVLSILEKHAVSKNNKIVLHWFSGSMAHAKQALQIGCYFSVNSQMLNNPKNHALLKLIPSDRLLTETDGPFTLHNQIPQRPKDVLICVQMISKILNRPAEEVKQNILKNLKQILT